MSTGSSELDSPLESNIKNISILGVVTHACIVSTWEMDAGGEGRMSPSLRPVWKTIARPYLQNEKNRKEGKREERKEGRKGLCHF
jgi:hypothetical protein